MAWTWQNYPDAMRSLSVRVRHKAIEIANALIREGYEEDYAIANAITTAKDWVEKNPPRKRKPQARRERIRSGNLP